MWIQTIDAYTSAVEFRGEPDSLMVRSRDKESLTNYCEHAGIDPARMYQDFPSDYPWRVKVTKVEHATYAYNAVMGIGYPNFKNAAKAARGPKYASFLMSVWTSSHSLTTPEDRAANQKAWAKYDSAKPKAKGKKGKKAKDTVLEDDGFDLIVKERWDAIEAANAAGAIDTYLTELEDETGAESGSLGVSDMTDREWEDFDQKYLQ